MSYLPRYSLSDLKPRIDGLILIGERTKLPEPSITVESARSRDSSAPEGSVDIVVSRDGKGRSYRTKGGTVSEVVQDAVKQIINDPYTGEFVKR